MALFVHGGFSQTRFLGASISNFSSSIGWNGSTSTLDMTLVEDLTNGDAFEPFYDFYGEVGKAKYFSIGDFSFGGYISNWKYSQSTSGYIINLSLEVPVNILQGVQVIIGGYHGTVFGVPNIYNLFGYYEPDEQDFGQALTNEAGMLWSKIKIIDQVINQFPIRFSGETYRINIDEIKALSTPQYYRIPSNGGAITILDLVTKVTQDAGCDYLVTLEQGNIFRFKVVSRKEQPTNLNTIANFVTGINLPNQRAFGKELRNDGPTNAFIVGPKQHRLWMLEQNGGIDPEEPLNNGFWPYWGKDINDNIILGQGADDNHYIDIDVGKSGFITEIGSMYRLTVGEMRAALQSREAWNLYVTCINPTTAIKLGMVQNGPDGSLTLLGQNADWLKIIYSDLFNPSAVLDFYLEEKINRLYNIIMDYANKYGKTYMVRIPFAVRTVEPETLIVKTSWEITDSGFLDETEDNPLDLLEEYEELFKNEQGKYTCFVRYDTPNDIDMTQFTDENALFQGEIVEVAPDPNTLTPGYDNFEFQGSLYVKADAKEIVYDENGDPWVVIELAAPVYQLEKRNWIKGKGLLYLLTQQNELVGLGQNLNPDQLEAKRIEAFNAVTSTMGYSEQVTDIHPAAIMPLKAAIPLQSNMLTYGPWYTTDGAEGQLHYEEDQDLAPWNYNSFALLNLVARAKISGIVSRMRVGEMGDCTIPGIPNKTIGEALFAGGPNITNINCSVDTQSGITTSYQLRTYAPTFGLFSKDFTERLSRMAQASRRLAREAELKTLSKFNISQLQRAQVVTKFKRLGTGMDANSGNSPVTVLMGRNINLSNEDTSIEARTYRPFVQATPASEYGPFIKGENVYRDTAVMSIDGLIRPYRTSSKLALAASGQVIRETYPSGLPVYDNSPIHKTSAYQPSTFICGNTLDPFPSGCDVNMLSFGETYPSGGINMFNRKQYHGGMFPSGEEVRAMGLRGPLVVVGWGYDWAGRPVPAKDYFYDPTDGEVDNYRCNTPTSGVENLHFDEDYLNCPAKWKVGPADLRWYQGRGVWGGYSPVILARAAEDCPSTSGNMLVYMGFRKHDFGKAGDCPTNWPGGVGRDMSLTRCHFWLSHPCIASGTALFVQYNAIDDLHYITNYDC